MLPPRKGDPERGFYVCLLLFYRDHELHPQPSKPPVYPVHFIIGIVE